MNDARQRVLFVCIGNACRSQMAEGFARAYGSDVLIAASAGLSPALGVMPDTLRAMLEKGIDLRDHFPKSYVHMARLQWDLVLNMSGYPLTPGTDAEVRAWDVIDPVCLRYDEHCAVRDEIEGLVMSLILELRRKAGPALISPA